MVALLVVLANVMASACTRPPAPQTLPKAEPDALKHIWKVSWRNNSIPHPIVHCRPVPETICSCNVQSLVREGRLESISCEMSKVIVMALQEHTSKPHRPPQPATTTHHIWILAGYQPEAQSHACRAIGFHKKHIMRSQIAQIAYGENVGTEGRLLSIRVKRPKNDYLHTSICFPTISHRKVNTITEPQSSS